jgi:hypothetical protein
MLSWCSPGSSLPSHWRLELSEHRSTRFKIAQMPPRKILHLERNDGRGALVARDAVNDARLPPSARAAAGGWNPVQQVDDRFPVAGPVLAFLSAGPCVPSDTRANGHDPAPE